MAPSRTASRTASSGGQQWRPDGQTDRRTERGSMSERGRPDLSPTQLVAGGLATATATVATSYLGVAGTLIGAAFMSVVTTAGAAVYQHYLDRGKRRYVTLVTTESRHHVAGRPGEPAESRGEPAATANPANPAEAG